MSERKDEANAWRLAGDVVKFIFWATVFYLLGSNQVDRAGMFVCGAMFSVVICRAPMVADDIERRAKARGEA